MPSKCPDALETGNYRYLTLPSLMCTLGFSGISTLQEGIPLMGCFSESGQTPRALRMSQTEHLVECRLSGPISSTE